MPGFNSSDYRDSKWFCEEVDRLSRHGHMPIMDAVLHLAEVKKMEPEMAASLLNADLRERIRIEAADLHLLQKSGTLPM